MAISEVTMKLNMDRYLRMALEEDITSEDVSANSVMDGPCRGEVDLICKQDGVIAGLQVFSRVFELLDDTFTMECFCKDGDHVENGQRVAVLQGDIRALLSGERTALNYLQRMSGIATHTAAMIKLVQYYTAGYPQNNAKHAHLRKIRGDCGRRHQPPLQSFRWCDAEG